MNEQEVNTLVGHLFRSEAGKMAAVLTRLLGFNNLEAAQDIVQDTLLKAVTIWRYKGIPENPSAWLYTVAKRKAIDILRQQKVRENIHAQISQSLQSEEISSPAVNQFFEENEIEDSQLRMIFACCHPAIPYESQIALTLKTLCGLTISEIAKSFLTSEETITKRLYRAREKIRSEKIELDYPADGSVIERSDAVLDTLYLLFSEGYNSSHPELLVRDELCYEAMRLCLILTTNKNFNTPKTNALLALMCLHASRIGARLNSRGEMVVLKEQNRSLWDVNLIQRGLEFLDIATEVEVVTEYHIEAAIAALHASADSFKTTNWNGIYNLYEVLVKIKPGVIVEMNKAIALGHATNAENGLKALLKIEGLEHNHWYHSALADFYLELNDIASALLSYDKAIQNTTSKVELELLQQKRKKITADSHQ